MLSRLPITLDELKAGILKNLKMKMKLDNYRILCKIS